MLPQPAVRLGSNPIGASLQQLELDASSTATKNAHHFIFDCIRYLSDQVKNPSIWHLAINSAREGANMITKFNVQIIYTSPSEAFNYLRIFLDQLPSTLIPESLFSITVEDKAFNERDSVSALKILPPHQHELLAAVVDLLRLVEQSSIDDNDKLLFRQSIESSLFKQWTNPERALAIMSNIMTQFGSDGLVSTESLDRNISACCEKIKEIATNMKMIEQYFAQDNRRTHEAKAQLKLFDVKLTAVREHLNSTKTLIDDYHLIVFDHCVNELNGYLASKSTNDLELVTKLPYMFNEVQKLLIAMSYHLDIFVHYTVQATGTDWSRNSELVHALETLTLIHLDGSMKNFWRDNIGSDKMIVLSDVLREALCSFAQIDWTREDIKELMRLLDYFGTGFVTIFTFADLMRSFGNNVELIRQAINCPYFHGYLGKEGFKLLHCRAQGSYLLRFNKHLVIDYFDKGVQKSRKVVTGPSGFALDLPNAQVYASLDDFIASLSSELTTPFLRKDSIINLPGYCGLPPSERKSVDLVHTYVFGLLHDGVGVEISCGLVQPASIRTPIYRFNGEGWSPPFSSVSYKSIEEALQKDFPMTKHYIFDHRVYQTNTERHLNAQEVSEETSIEFFLQQKRPVKIVNLRHIDIESTPNVDLLSTALLNNESLTSVEIVFSGQSARLVRALYGHPNIRQLTVKDVVENSIVNDYIVELMASLPKLEKIVFGSGLPDLIIGAIKATRLKELQMEYINTDKIMDAIFSLVTNNTSLTALHVMKPLGQMFKASVLNRISQLPLKELRIDTLSAQFGRNVPFNSIENLTLMDPQDADLSIISTMHNLKELRVFTDHNAIHNTSFKGDVKQLYNIPQLKWCGMHHHVLCPVWKDRPIKALFLATHACGTMAFSLNEFNRVIEDQPNVEYLSLRGFDSADLNAISPALIQLQKLKVLRLDLQWLPRVIELNSRFVNALAQLTSLRAIFIIGNVRVLDEKEIIETVPNLARLEIGGRGFGSDIHNLASPLLSIPASAIIHLQDSVTAMSAIRDARTGQRFRRHTRALRQRITDRIVDLIVVMHNIVRSSEALHLLPIEIWTSIFDGLSFHPFLDFNGVFKKIAQNAPNVTRVVDWHEFLKPPEAWDIWN